MHKTNLDLLLYITISAATKWFEDFLICACIKYMYMYMINTHTLEKDKTYKSNPKATTFQRKIAASGGI